MGITTTVYVAYNALQNIECYATKTIDEFYGKTTYAVCGRNVSEKSFNEYLIFFNHLPENSRKTIVSSIEI